MLSTCKTEYLYKDIQHILLRCRGLPDEQRQLNLFTTDYVSDKPVLKKIVDTYLYSDAEDDSMQFYIDFSVLPAMVIAVHGQIIHQQLIKIRRTWCRSVYVARESSWVLY